jgi:hypothetical protein
VTEPFNQIFFVPEKQTTRIPTYVSIHKEIFAFNNLTVVVKRLVVRCTAGRFSICSHVGVEEIKSRLKSGNAFYHSVQNLLSSSLLSKNLKIKIYRTIILPVVLYVYEIWSLTLREARRLSVFKNRMLSGIFGPRRDEVTGKWRKLHNEELNNLYSSSSIVRVIKSRRMTWAGHVAHMGESRGMYRVLVGKPEGRRPLGRPKRRWEVNVRMGVREVGCGCVDWMELAQDRDRWRALVSALINLRVP